MALWTEPEALHDPEQKRVSRRETFVRSPHWLFAVYPHGGHQGFWGLERPRVVAGHLIEMRGNAQMPKRFALKTYNWCAASPFLHPVSPLCSTSAEQTCGAGRAGGLFRQVD